MSSWTFCLKCSGIIAGAAETAGFAQSCIHKEAKDLLIHTRLEVKAITFELGLDDPSYFSKSFVRMEGIGPSEFRKLNRPTF